LRCSNSGACRGYHHRQSLRQPRSQCLTSVSTESDDYHLVHPHASKQVQTTRNRCFRPLPNAPKTHLFSANPHDRASKMPPFVPVLRVGGWPIYDEIGVVKSKMATRLPVSRKRSTVKLRSLAGCPISAAVSRCGMQRPPPRQRCGSAVALALDYYRHLAPSAPRKCARLYLFLYSVKRKFLPIPPNHLIPHHIEFSPK
jgi:hypothetical protein